MADDLFAAAAEERLSGRSLAARLRPRNLDDVVGQRHLLAPGRPLRALIEGDRLSSVIFWAHPNREDEPVALDRADDREGVRRTVGGHGVGEGRAGRDCVGSSPTRRARHRNDPVPRRGAPVQQGPTGHAAARRGRGADRADRGHHRKPALRGQSATDVATTLFRLHALDETDIAELVRRGLEVEGASADADAVEHLAGRAGGDGRHALTSTEVAVAWPQPEGVRSMSRSTMPRVPSTPRRSATAATATTTSSVPSSRASVARTPTLPCTGSPACSRQERTPFHRSTHGDPRLEDIGMADPQALLVATAAAQAVEFVGLPEAQLNLAQAAIHLATSPKSNRSPRRSSRPRPPLVRLAPVRCRRTCVMRITGGGVARSRHRLPVSP